MRSRITIILAVALTILALGHSPSSDSVQARCLYITDVAGHSFYDSCL